MWYATDVSREELFRRLRHLEPSEPFRSTFQYLNQMYMTAGYLAGQISGSTWETFTRRRLLEPLGMSRSTVSVDSMQQTDNYARPYSGGRNTAEATDYYSIGAIGPAGGINSSVSEMTNCGAGGPALPQQRPVADSIRSRLDSGDPLRVPCAPTFGRH
jgi:CubicO group peptidase (beta-lactamase class C family)